MKRTDLINRVIDLRNELKYTENKDKIKEEIDRIVNYLRDTEFEYDINDLVYSLKHHNDKLNRTDAINVTEYNYNGCIDKEDE